MAVKNFTVKYLCSGRQYLSQLSDLYQAMNIDANGVNKKNQQKEKSMMRLRVIVDAVMQRLPPLLELGDVPEELVVSVPDFPYHRASICSSVNLNTNISGIPEAIRYVFLQVIIKITWCLCCPF